MISRRKLLVFGGLAAVASAAPAMLINCSKNDEWAFFTRQFPIPNLDTAAIYRHIQKNCVPLGPERAMVEGSELANEFVSRVRPSLEPELTKAGMDPNGEYTAIATGQSYGEPDSPETAEKLLDYSKKAVDYLYSRIKGLERFGINWAILKPGQDFGKNFDGNAYIGQKWYLVKRAHFMNRKDPGQKLTLIHLDHRFGGLMDFAPTQQMGLSLWYAFLGATSDGIKAPFSEFLARGTIKNMLKHYSGNGHDFALKANETIHDSIGEILAREFVRTIGFDSAIPLLDANLKSAQAKPLYSDVPKGIRWAQKNSVQAAYDLYMESPKKYMEAINSA